MIIKHYKTIRKQIETINERLDRLETFPKTSDYEEIAKKVATILKSKHNDKPRSPFLYWDEN